jgi:ATP-binding protein involved in chromosome partitioning
VLLVDMPPGTGDAQLAIAQGARLSGAVIVSTPQDLSLIDARRGISMFRKVDVPILGVVENMAHFLCPTCGAAHAIFGQGRRRAPRPRAWACRSSGPCR